ncbi:MAG: ribosomal-processing cysteine protease Prp [Defluviitaleaceae bacterium]|nr:ribosomal-processing cysteine protease Prp [Defluviitaleaceae bacterium]
MIKVDVFYNDSGDIYRFKVINHGDPIVCAGVSALVITAVNFIQDRLKVSSKLDYKDSDYIDFEFETSKEAVLIAEHMLFGIEQIRDSYKNQIKIFTKKGDDSND